MHPTHDFHPAVAAWLDRAFAGPTPAQRDAWPRLQRGEDVLIAAPTGSGKTLAAFMAAIDGLVRAPAPLPERTAVLYVSPLKALSNDIHKNLELPLAGIDEELARLGLPPHGIRTLVRTGDTPAAERTAMRKRPPHIVITTPESFYVLLGSESGRAMLSGVSTVIVDEIHALAGNKRGTHLALSLERLQALRTAAGGGPLQRIGLSATQRPIELVARFLLGGKQREEAAAPACAIVDSGHMRERDLQIVMPPSPLQAVMSNEVWEQLYDQLAALIREHRTTLVFVNTRRHAERVARHLSERLGEEHVTAHHGSLSRERRLNAEQRLKSGELRALVATASLELGIDIGDIDLVCQVGSCRSISTFLQRAGRAGHFLGGTPKARLFPLARDELCETVALLEAVGRGELDRLQVPELAFDVLAQQIVAEVAAQEWDEEALFEAMRAAFPYRHLSRGQYDQVLHMLAEGFATRRGAQRQYLHRDAVQGRLRGRRGARLTALTSGGTIPDNADYNVVLEPEGTVVGTVNEDFAVESLAGDIFQLGNTSFRILRVEAGRVRVEDAHGQPPTIPFWLGEAPGRSDELSAAVARLQRQIDGDGELSASLDRLVDEGIDRAAATQLVDYLWSAKRALGALPTGERIILERFFDESGGMQLVIHAPFGSRINRAWGLALRKRFCRKFNFELQAAATEEAIIFSLSTSHSFPLAEVVHYLNAGTVRDVLIQALLDAPMFTARWRWSAGIALALPRFRGGRKTPPQLQRMYAEDLIADLFPDQIACAENLAGPRDIPDHPLVQQAIRDCLEEAMDIEGLERLLRRIDAGEIEVVAKDVTEPSPLATQILAARPYAYLDDAPLEERRTQAVMSRRWLDPDSAADLGRLDPQAIAQVREEAFPSAQNADELHDALMWCGFLTLAETGRVPGSHALLETLVKQRRATRLTSAAGPVWIAVERLPRLAALFPEPAIDPQITAPPPYADERPAPEQALLEIVRGRLQLLGPVTATELAAPLALDEGAVGQALLALEGEGFLLRGNFDADAEQWCERGLLARIHRYTLNRLRAEIEPVTTQDFMRFLFAWQHAVPGERKEGPDALPVVLASLEGFEAPAAGWESELLALRIRDYQFTWLDDLCLAGRAGWLRLAAPEAKHGGRRSGPVRSTPIALVERRYRGIWQTAAGDAGELPAMSSRADRVVEALQQGGASFFDEMLDAARMLPTELEAALAELAALGVVSSDSFAGIRALLVPSEKRKPFGGGQRRGRRAAFGIQDAGRWSLVRAQKVSGDAVAEHVVEVLLRRYGVIFWRLLAREADWLPPWRDLLRVLRRLEARGEIRGGRFVAGVSGEQYALPEALGSLRAIRRQPHDGQIVAVSGADPLNLVGVLLPGARVPALVANRILFRDGVALAALVGREAVFYGDFPAGERAQMQQWLVRRGRGISPLPVSG